MPKPHKNKKTSQTKSLRAPEPQTKQFQKTLLKNPSQTNSAPSSHSSFELGSGARSALEVRRRCAGGPSGSGRLSRGRRRSSRSSWSSRSSRWSRARLRLGDQSCRSWEVMAGQGITGFGAKTASLCPNSCWWYRHDAFLIFPKRYVICIAAYTLMPAPSFVESKLWTWHHSSFDQVFDISSASKLLPAFAPLTATTAPIALHSIKYECDSKSQQSEHWNSSTEPISCSFFKKSLSTQVELEALPIKIPDVFSDMRLTRMYIDMHVHCYIFVFKETVLINICIYTTCKYMVCICRTLYVCMYVRAYVCMDGQTDRRTDGRTCVCMRVYMCVCCYYIICVCVCMLYKPLRASHSKKDSKKSNQIPLWGLQAVLRHLHLAPVPILSPISWQKRWPIPVIGNPKYVDPVPGFSGVYLLFREIDYWDLKKITGGSRK
jgi:hypothetical protein